MIRLRKYRIFLAVTICCLLVVYFFSKASPQYTPESWTGFRRPPVSGPQPAPNDKSKLPGKDAAGVPGKYPQPDVANGRIHPRPTTAPILDYEPVPAQEHPKTPDNPTGPAPKYLSEDTAAALQDAETLPKNGPDAPPLPTPIPHWTPKIDTFPIATESLIPLPSGAPMAIPRIQHVFTAESASEKAARETKLDAVKVAFRRTWEGYRQHAWMADELTPATGGPKSKWAGWAATLVDSLDTLWIMDMQPEFDEAVKAVAKIDFTTADRPQIPVFETTIRYLGGLLGAYDVSGAKYQILLDKAKELGELLMGAFDTPNRMPILFFEWQGDRAANSWRASSSAVLAELGSLSLEFTRLAQLTHDSKYYDAIARITNALEIFQNKTEVPGLWPLHVDSGGCGPPDVEDRPDPLKDTNTFGTDRSSAPTPHDVLDEDDTLDDEDDTIDDEDIREKDKTSFVEGATKLAKRQLDEIKESTDSDDEYLVDLTSCPPAGLQTSEFKAFAIGGEADSTYEYLPKEYLMLGGLNNQYRTMYTTAARAIKEHLMYRPMIEDEKREILFTGKYSPYTRGPDATGRAGGILDTSLGHLTCFQGGMFALAAKIFDIKADLDIASKFADGCVWGYDSSGSGIMPEDITPVKCPSLTDCPWNQTTWWLEIDPAADSRALERDQRRDLAQPPDIVLDKRAGHRAKPGSLNADFELDALNKRQVDGTELVDDDDTLTPAAPDAHRASANFSHRSNTHKEYVQRRIADEGLWPGIKGITNAKYLLRPEAIESVWYMYRITGDEYWRQKGWKMFQAVETNTKTIFGNSAIDNVQRKHPSIMDEMESFWTAETLKYFFLLFSPPDVISLDDYVLSTEAHPFLRPDSKKRF